MPNDNLNGIKPVQSINLMGIESFMHGNENSNDDMSLMVEEKKKEEKEIIKKDLN